MVFLCFYFSSSWKTCFLLPVNKKLTTYIQAIWVAGFMYLDSFLTFQNWILSENLESEMKVFLLPSLPTHSSSSQGRKALLRTYLEGPFRTVVPNPFSTRDRFNGRQCFHGPRKQGRGVRAWGWFKHITCLVHNFLFLFIIFLIMYLLFFTSIITALAPPQVIRHWILDAGDPASGHIMGLGGVGSSLTSRNRVSLCGK